MLPFKITIQVLTGFEPPAQQLKAKHKELYRVIWVKSHVIGDAFKCIHKKVRFSMWLGTLGPEAVNGHILPSEEFISWKYLK